ncbi:MAG: nucleoside triphosphate pyrophosphohydrolase [Acidimicrobiia bacterium]|nr:nucleoside triphosphate pyrophosphohydrolase [Acidimicrobiia bacterium]
MAESIGARFERLVSIMRALRAPDGCPWDREQTHASLRRFVLEETYEVIEAIDGGDPSALCEELGDYLFEAVFLAQLSDEAGDFDIGDAIQTVCDKLVRRHPHVFARDSQPGDAPLSAGQVVERWDALKAKERADSGRPDQLPPGALGRVPTALPALLRAHQVGSRAASTGFDWPKAADVLEKIDEEVAELRAELEAGLGGDGARVEEEMGDLLFAIANLSRKLGVEPESALRRATSKFTDRFERMERTIQARGHSLADTPLAELESEWQRAKLSPRSHTRKGSDPGLTRV